MVARDRDGIEARNLRGREFDHVGHDPNGGLGRADPFLLRDELLEPVVLHRPAGPTPGPALLLGDPAGHGPPPPPRAVVRPRRPDIAEGDPAEKALEIVPRPDPHAL